MNLTTKATTLASLTLLLACGADQSVKVNRTQVLEKVPIGDNTGVHYPVWATGIAVDGEWLKAFIVTNGPATMAIDIGFRDPTSRVKVVLVTNVTTEVRTVTLTNLMLQCVTTNSGGVFTNLVPVMTVGTNVGERYVCPPNRNAFFSTLQGLGTGVYSNGGAE